nr:MAG TPA: hypothetical protein [Bacteriophage sp.]
MWTCNLERPDRDLKSIDLSPKEFVSMGLLSYITSDSE